MKIEILTPEIASHPSELLAVFSRDTGARKSGAASEREQKQILLLSDNPVLEHATRAVRTSGEYSAASTETLLLHSPAGLAARRLLLVGVAEPTPEELRRAAGVVIRFAKSRNLREAAILFPSLESSGSTDADPEPMAMARALAEGALIADFDSDTYLSDRKDKSIVNLAVLLETAGARAAVEAGVQEGRVLGEAQNFARSLVNEPGNLLTPTILGTRAREMCGKHGLKCEVYGKEKLQELKMGAFLSVSQGSEEPPALIVMTYEPEQVRAGLPVLGLVGKGITFDTGGISLKHADGMEKMKYDMAGGAAMIGAMQAIAELKPPVKVIGIVCAAENMPSGKAQKPGDVRFAMSGRSIEVINTDAEGRLVLADGLAYAQQLGATRLIDAATLTGACVVALGTVNAGVFSNNDAEYERFQAAARPAGERFWRLPLDDEYREMIKSGIADIRNTGGSRWGGAITAAMFLKEFVGDTPWIHLDIAGLAWIEDAKPWIAKGPSGIAVRSITQWVRNYSIDPGTK